MTLDGADLAVLGQGKKIIITKDDTIIMGGAGAKNDVEERVSSIGD